MSCSCEQASAENTAVQCTNVVGMPSRALETKDQKTKGHWKESEARLIWLNKHQAQRKDSNFYATLSVYKRELL